MSHQWLLPDQDPVHRAVGAVLFAVVCRFYLKATLHSSGDRAAAYRLLLSGIRQDGFRLRLLKVVESFAQHLQQAS